MILWAFFGVLVGLAAGYILKDQTQRPAPPGGNVNVIVNDNDGLPPKAQQAAELEKNLAAKNLEAKGEEE